MPYARKGAEAAEASAKSANFPGRIDFIRFKDGDIVFVRMVEDPHEWNNAEMHQFIPTKPAPSNYKGDKWPASMSATCQMDEMFRNRDADGELAEGYEEGYGQCYIHANYADQLDKFDKPRSATTPLVFALCVLREPVLNEAGAIIKMRDITEDWTDPKTKAKRKVPALRIISQRWGNFFSPMKAGAFLDNTVTNKDWRIERTGNDYHINPLPPTPDHAPGTPSWKIYTDAIELLRADVFGMLCEQGSAKYYQRFFIPGEHDSEDEAGGSHDADPAPGADVSDEEMKAFRDRLLASPGASAATS